MFSEIFLDWSLGSSPALQNCNNDIFFLHKNIYEEITDPRKKRNLKELESDVHMNAMSFALKPTVLLQQIDLRLKLCLFSMYLFLNFQIEED